LLAHRFNGGLTFSRGSIGCEHSTFAAFAPLPALRETTFQHLSSMTYFFFNDHFKAEPILLFRNE